MTVADDLRAGATYIREHGHARRTAEAGDGTVCALGAIARVVGARDLVWAFGDLYLTSTPAQDRYAAAVAALHEYLFADKTPGRLAVADWSDAMPTDDVITGMEKAAAWIEERA